MVIKREYNKLLGTHFLITSTRDLLTSLPLNPGSPGFPGSPRFPFSPLEPSCPWTRRQTNNHLVIVFFMFFLPRWNNGSSSKSSWPRLQLLTFGPGFPDKPTLPCPKIRRHSKCMTVGINGINGCHCAFHNSGAVWGFETHPLTILSLWALLSRNPEPWAALHSKKQFTAI